MHQEQTESQAQKHSLKIQWISAVFTVLVLAIAAVIVLAPEFAGWGYLHWAARHPVLRARYDPHHWLARIAVLIILVSMVRVFASVLRQPLATLLAWRRVFFPLPWEQSRSPK